MAFKKKKKKATFSSVRFYKKKPYNSTTQVRAHKTPSLLRAVPQKQPARTGGDRQRAAAGLGGGGGNLDSTMTPGIVRSPWKPRAGHPAAAPHSACHPPLFFGFRASRVPAAPARPYRTPRPPAPRPAASLALGPGCPDEERGRGAAGAASAEARTAARAAHRP